MLRSTVDAVGCTLLPDSCTLCGTPLPRLSFAPICDVCWAEIPPLDGISCLRCGDSLDPRSVEAGREFCRPCRLAPPSFERAVSFGLYDGRMRDVIHALKYEGARHASFMLGGKLALAIEQLAPVAPSDLLVVPVPLHRSRYRSRGFNQTRLLADQALKQLARSHPAWKLTLAPKALLRVRATHSQAGLSPRGRRLNMRKAFAVGNADAVRDRDVLLLDDILTTGSTVRAASRVLLGAGAKSVWVATLARARRGNFGQISEFQSWTKEGGVEENAPHENHAVQSMLATEHQPSF